MLWRFVLLALSIQVLFVTVGSCQNFLKTTILCLIHIHPFTLARHVVTVESCQNFLKTTILCLIHINIHQGWAWGLRDYFLTVHGRSQVKILGTVVFNGRFDPNQLVQNNFCFGSFFHSKPFSELRPMIEEGKDKLEWTRQVS